MSDYELSWHTLITEICGSTWFDQVDSMMRVDLVAGGLYADNFAAYPHKSQLIMPEIKLDIKAVALAAEGFGAFPGYERWIVVVGINGDCKVDIKDVAQVSRDFGGVG